MFKNYPDTLRHGFRLATLVLITSLSSPTTYGQNNSPTEVRYVTDILYVPIRSGQGNQYRIVNAGLKSGAQLTFLEEGDSGEWTRVRTAAGIEGWIPNQYIIEEQPGRLQLTRATAELARLKKSNTQLAAENNAMKKANAELTNKSSSDSSARSKMSSELERIKNLSASAISLEKNYRELLEKHQLLQTEKDVLTAENEKLANDNRVNFMLYGVGILLIGVLLAYILPAIKPKKRYSEWS
mgnify:CR=1 FL=1